MSTVGSQVERLYTDLGDTSHGLGGLWDSFTMSCTRAWD